MTPRTASHASELPVSAEALERFTSHSATLVTAVNEYLESELSWYRSLSTDDRSSLKLIAQRGVQGLRTWLHNPRTRSLALVNELLGPAPTDLMRSISLQRALELIRTIVEAVEKRLPGLMEAHDQQPMLEAVLRYSREIAFAIADVYARAAESRGAWDSRLEAILVDAVLRGDGAEEIASRAAAVGWQAQSDMAVVVASAAAPADSVFLSQLRRQSARAATDLAVGVQGSRIILILGGVRDVADVLKKIQPLCTEGPIVYSTHSGGIADAAPAAQAALMGYRAASAWSQAPRPVDAADLLPERVFAGDDAAKETLINSVFTTLETSGHGLLETTETYVQAGHSLEATARNLYVHTNTVRYRLKRVAELTGWDPMVARDAFVLQIGLSLGRL